jgi:hypothetical protein
MTSRLTTSIRRILTSTPAQEAVHFHLHHDGLPFVCDLDRCSSPALTLGEVERRAARPL